MKRLLTVVPALALVAGLSACGGGGDDAPVLLTPPPSTGTFTDAPVAGLSYACNPSGLAGTTDAEGHFEFREGDTVVFSVGSVDFPPVTATGTVTPREIAAEIVAADDAAAVEDVATNLFVFFQSLDTDDDPNTITFPDLAGVTFTEPGFTAPPATFQEEMATSIAEIEQAVPGLDLELVTVDEALAHAAEQGAALLAGTWRLHTSRPNGDPVNLAITFFANGTYLKGGLENDPNCNEPGADADGNGAEFGPYEWNALTGDFTTGTPTINTDGSCGLQNIAAGAAALQVDADELHFHGFGDTPEECDAIGGTYGPYIDGRDACSFALTRADNEPTAIVGSFGFRDLSEAGPTVLTIERTGASSYRYILVEAHEGRNTPIESTPDDNTDGVEIGTFTLDSSGITQGVTPSLDTNDSGGLDTTDDPNESFRLTIENGQLQVEERQSGEVTGLFLLDRLPQAPQIVQADVVGSYFAAGFDDADVEIAQASEGFPGYITFLDNGEYLLGAYHNDSTCVVSAETDKANGDGIEFGRYALDVISGELVATIPAPTLSKQYVDTNGECGLVHKGGTSDRLFLRRLKDGDGEGLLLLSFDDSGGDSVADVAAAFEAVRTIDTIAEAKAFAEGAVNGDKSFVILRPVVSQADASVNQGFNGAWKLTQSTFAGDTYEGGVIPVVITLVGNRYLLLHGTIGERQAIDGIEFGTFMVNESGQFCVIEVFVDTTGDAGLANGAPTECSAALTVSIAEDLDTFTVTAADGSATFTRMSEPYVAP